MTTAPVQGGDYVTERILIWGKTYPELSRRYSETVCTAGVRADGSPIRLYPVPLRYLNDENQYKLWDWIDVPVRKAEDTRPESFKIRADGIRHIDRVPTDDNEWAGRREVISRDTSWHFADVGALKAAQRECGRSFGFVAPGSIEGIYLRRKSAQEEAEYNAKIEEIQAQRDMFLPEYKELGFRRQEIRLQWRCPIRCPECANGPHDMQVLDWGLIELARKNRWDWDLAKRRLEEIANLDTHDFRLFLGNMKAHPTAFTIVGLWYPLRRPQIQLL